MATSRAPLVLALVSSAAAYNAAVVQSRPLRPAVLQRVSITAAVAEAAFCEGAFAFAVSAF